MSKKLRKKLEGEARTQDDLPEEQSPEVSASTTVKAKPNQSVVAKTVPKKPAKPKKAPKQK